MKNSLIEIRQSMIQFDCRLVCLIIMCLLFQIIFCQGQEAGNAFDNTFVNTIFSADGKTFLTQDTLSHYEVWRSDGSLQKRFTDMEADVATISKYVRPLGIEYPEPSVNHKFTYTENKESLYTLTVNGKKIFEQILPHKTCAYADYLPAKEVGTVYCFGEKYGDNHAYLIKPNQPAKELDLGGTDLISNSRISPDGKIIVSPNLQAAYSLETNKILWTHSGSARFSPNDSFGSSVITEDYSLTFSPDSKFMGMGDQKHAIVIDLTNGKTVREIYPANTPREVTRSYRWLPDMGNFVDSGGNFGRASKSQHTDFSTWKEEFGLTHEMFNQFVTNVLLGSSEANDGCHLEQSQILPGEKFASNVSSNIWYAPTYGRMTKYYIVAAGNKNFEGIRADFGDTVKTIPPTAAASEKWKVIAGGITEPFNPHDDIRFSLWIINSATFFKVTPISSDSSPAALLLYKCS